MFCVSQSELKQNDLYTYVSFMLKVDLLFQRSKANIFNGLEKVNGININLSEVLQYLELGINYLYQNLASCLFYKSSIYFIK